MQFIVTLSRTGPTSEEELSPLLHMYPQLQFLLLMESKDTLPPLLLEV